MSGGIGCFKPVSLKRLKPGNLYLWSPDPKDYRTWVSFFHFSDGAGADRPPENTIFMYLGYERFGSEDAYIFLIGDQKYAVYNDDFRYGLKEV